MNRKTDMQDITGCAEKYGVREETEMKKVNETWHKECAHAYFLENVQGIGIRTTEKLYEKYGSYEEIYKRGDGWGLSEKQRLFFETRKQNWNIKEEYEKLLRNKIWYVPKYLAGYPVRLKRTEGAPSGLFVKGKLPDENMLAVAVVGARKCSPYGHAVAKTLGKSLAERGIQVVSGLAAGVDGLSQRGAVENGGASFGILGCGVDICYPPENRDVYERLAAGDAGGGIISEFLPGTKPEANHFPMRNRIISGISDLLVVVEAREKSGTFITVSDALEQGKDVYVVPGRIGDALSYGCNRLVSQGAGIIYDTEAFIEEISAGYSCKRKGERGNLQERESLTGDVIKPGTLEAAVFAVLDIQYCPVEDIWDKLGDDITVQEVLTVLATLECQNLVEVKGSFYRKKVHFL